MYEQMLHDCELHTEHDYGRSRLIAHFIKSITSPEVERPPGLPDSLVTSSLRPSRIRPQFMAVIITQVDL
jgi:hypothetical protein